MRLDAAFFDRGETGDILSRLIVDVGQIRTALSTTASSRAAQFRHAGWRCCLDDRRKTREAGRRCAGSDAFVVGRSLQFGDRCAADLEQRRTHWLPLQRSQSSSSARFV